MKKLAESILLWRLRWLARQYLKLFLRYQKTLILPFLRRKGIPIAELAKWWESEGSREEWHSYVDFSMSKGDDLPPEFKKFFAQRLFPIMESSNDPERIEEEFFHQVEKLGSEHYLTFDVVSDRQIPAG